MKTSSMEKYALPILRFGIVSLFLWFGISQVMSAENWIAWVPEWPIDLTGLSAQSIVLLNGWFEIVLGIFLALGFYTRVAATLLALHLLFVAYEIGYNDIGVRDFALAVSTLALALFAPDQYTLDTKLKKE